MGRRQVGIKFDVGRLERLDAAVEAHGWKNRTALVEAACDVMLGQMRPPARGEVKARPRVPSERVPSASESQRGVDRSSVGGAGFGCPRCEFRAPSPAAVCPTHGRRVRPIGE